VLLKVRVPHDREGQTAIANVELSYRDLTTGSDGHCGGKLGTTVVAGAGDASDLDPVVSGRAQRSETAAALKEANGLFEQGKLEEARRRLASREASLRAAAEKARKAAPAGRAADVDKDFAGQLDAVAAQPQFATPPPAAGAAPTPAPQETRGGKSAVRANQKKAFDLAF